MTTIYNVKDNFFKDNEQFILLELRGLSTDEKPTMIGDANIENGSVFIEIDTQNIYFYDLASKEWIIPTSDTQSNEEES